MHDLPAAAQEQVPNANGTTRSGDIKRYNGEDLASEHHAYREGLSSYCKLCHKAYGKIKVEENKARNEKLLAETGRPTELDKKTCSKCCFELPWYRFNFDMKNQSGLQSQCRDCQKDGSASKTNRERGGGELGGSTNTKKNNNDGFMKNKKGQQKAKA